MLYRLTVAGVCAVMLAGCQQSGPTLNSVTGPTAPSSLVQPSLHQSVPFSGVVAGEAQFDFVTNPKGCASGFTTITDAKGTASHMGVALWHSEHCFSPLGQLLDAQLVLTAASGDEIHATYTGSCAPPGEVGDPILCGGSAVFSGGTGRFVNTSGTAEWTGEVIWQGLGVFTTTGRWTWSGSISY